MDLARALQSHPLFVNVSPETLAAAVCAAVPVSYSAGDVCLRSDESGDVFGVLISGRLEAVRGRGAQRRHLGYIEAGECFGEMSLLTGNPTNAEVVAVEESEAIVFLQEAISPLIATSPEAIRFLGRMLTGRLAPKRPELPLPASHGRQYRLGAAGPMQVLAVSCNWQEVRYAYFDTSGEEARAHGRATGLDTGKAIHRHAGPKGERQNDLAPATHDAALEAALGALGADGLIGSPSDLSAIGHCVRHGGIGFNGPAIVDEAVKQEIRRLSDLMPRDNPYNLSGIETCQRLAPGVPQVAVFDTAFHLTMPPAAHHYALPQDLAHDADLRRFGFHGISHEGAVRAAAAHLGRKRNTLQLVSCHLGVGASVAAIDHGRSVDNSMGMTPLAGLVMATRPGDVDPGLLLHLIRDRKMDPDELYRRLFDEAGLLGVSGVSGDVLEVMEAAEKGHVRALLALQMFCQRARKYVSGYIGLLGGVDAILFTGGVGQNSPGVRARICQGLGWMGIVLDDARNRAAEVGRNEVVDVEAPQSRVRILVVGGDEEHTIARHTVRALAHARVTEVMRGTERPIPIGISVHHVHLTQEHVEALFGQGHTLTWHSDLSQSGEFACKGQVTIVGPKGRIDRVRVIGPVRSESQVEIARTEEFKLGIDAPIRLSGDLAGTPGITLEGPAGQVRLSQGVICAMRHIHMAPEDAMGFAVRDRDVVRVRVPGDRELIFGDVVVRVAPNFRLEMHVDTDEANAAELAPGAVGYLDSIQRRAAG